MSWAQLRSKRLRIDNCGFARWTIARTKHPRRIHLSLRKDAVKNFFKQRQRWSVVPHEALLYLTDGVGRTALTI